MTEVSLLGFPHFGEAAARLKRLRQKFLQCLHTHQSSRPEASDEAVPNGAGYVLSEDDVDPTCLSLLTQLDDLADRLMELDPPFESWQNATHQVNDVLQRIENHADQLA